MSAVEELRPGSMGAIALDYQNGLSPLGGRLRVFPVVRGGKEPLVNSGFKAASDIAIEARAWWADEKWPLANIGIPMGLNGLVCLDVDVKGGAQGEASLAALIERIGPLPSTLTARTPSGGWHYIFRVGPPRADGEIGRSTGFKSSTNLLGPGLDIKSDNGYVLVAPSIVGGRSYEWVDETVPVADLPEALAKAIRMAVREQKAATSSPTGDGPFELPDIIKKGTRRDILNQYGCALKKRGFDMGTVEAMLREADRTRCQPPYVGSVQAQKLEKAIDEVRRFVPTDEIAAIEAVIDAEVARFWSQSNAALVAMLIESDTEPEPPKGYAGALMLRGSQITSVTLIEPPKVVKGLFSKGRQFVFVGASGSAKSWGLFEFGVCYGCPEIDTFLGQPMVEHGTVVIESWEQGPDEDMRRVQKLLIGHGLAGPCPPSIILQSQPALTLNDDDAFAERLRFFERERVGLYLLDSLSEGSGTDLNDNATYSDWHRRRIAPLLKMGITVVVTHLRGHITGKPGALLDPDAVFRGATQIRALCQGAVEFRDLKKDRWRLIHNKHRDVPELPFGELRLAGGFDDPDIRLVLIEADPEGFLAKRLRGLCQKLAGQEPLPTRTALAVIGGNKNATTELLETAVARGLVTRKPKGQAFLYAVNPAWDDMLAAMEARAVAGTVGNGRGEESDEPYE